MISDSHTVLFLCTGNYYRSRFAEYYFNELVRTSKWHALSRGLAVEWGSANVGPMARTALDELNLRGVLVREPIPYPTRLSGWELEMACHIVAVDEDEHRPLVSARYPGWEEVIEYWHVKDVQQVAPEIAIPELASLVEKLAVNLTGITLPGRQFP
jgi:protein-tyrosine phosphatase